MYSCSFSLHMCEVNKSSIYGVVCKYFNVIPILNRYTNLTEVILAQEIN